MADVITRFKLETSQYDSKLRDASKALAEIGKEAMDAGKDFDKFAKESIESAKALGSIGTTATTAKGKVQELVGAYNDVAKAYNKLTEDQKQSDFGKAMAGSLQELQGRIKEAKSELYGLGDSGKNTGGIMSQLADKFTINIDALKLFNMGLQASKAALGVAKDALFASEATVDEWGRIVQSSESLYQGFLTALNTGDISGYLSRMDDIVAAARKAYDELDKLGSMKTIQGPEMSRQEAENSRLRMMIQTGRYIASYDGGNNPWGLRNGDQLNAEQIRAIEQQLQEGMNKIVALTDKEVKQTGNAIDAYYDSLAKQNGMSMAEFKRGTQTWEDFASRLEGYQKYLDFEREHTTTTSTYSPSAGMVRSPSRDNAINPYAEYANWGVFRVDKMGSNSYNDLVSLIKQQQSQVSQMYSTMGQAYRVINRAEGTTVRSIMGGGSGGKGGSGDTPAPGSINAMKKHIQELQDAFNEATNQGVRDGLRTAINEANTELARMSGTLPAEGSIEALRAKVKELQDEFNKTADQSIRGQLLVAIDEAQKKLDFMSGKGVSLLGRQNTSLTEHLGLGFDAEKLKKDINPVDFDNSKIVEAIVEQWTKQLDRESNNEQRDEIITTIGKLKGALGNVVSGLKSIGIELPEEVNALLGAIQGVGQIISSVGAIIELVSATSETANTSAILANTSALIALTTAMTTNSFLSLIPLARGGIVRAAGGGVVKAANGYEVPGNYYSGDMVPAFLNSGELVLNRAQQGVLAASLQDQAAGRSQNLLAKVKGTDLIVMLDRTGRMTGKGELAFWKD